MTRTDFPETMRGFFARNKLLLAPMAGVTDVVFRELCLEQGASLTFTEMVSAKGLSYDNHKTACLLERGKTEERIAVQLFGHEPDTMAAQARRIEEELGDTLVLVDINMGCPARKIVSKGDGAALMTKPDLAADIVRAVADEARVPITVKFRRGYEEGQETAPAFAEKMQAAGAAALTVHGRFAKQMYRGVSERETIARVVRSVDIPVVGNGDITDVESMAGMFEHTGCDAVMIARAARGNPWVFARLSAYLNGTSIPAAPTYEERIAMASRHAHMLVEGHGASIVRMRKHAMWYLAGIPGASRARECINACTTLDAYEGVLDELLAYLADRARED